MEVWAENVPAFDLFVAVRTQWRVGMAGPSGLDYAGVRACMDLLGTPEGERPRLFADLQVMEAAALEHFRSN